MRKGDERLKKEEMITGKDQVEEGEERRNCEEKKGRKGTEKSDEIRRKEDRR